MSTPAAAVDLVEHLADREIIVVCGSGGVGKTTISAALGMAVAATQQKRVIVLTVDPARRLATALGLRSIGTDPVTIDPARLRRLGLRPRGELVAAMLDMKSTWDRMIERYAPTRESARRILANPFYKGISNTFIGSQDYMAMEELYELHSGREYDCVIIDTPPTRNALDFLEAPNRISDFVGGRLLMWLARPSLIGWRAVNFAAAPFLRMADRLLGSDVLEELAEFVREVQGLYSGVQERARSVYRLLRSADTGFVVVTTLEPQPFGEAEFFCTKLREYSMPLRAVVVNRVLPAALLDPAGVTAATTLMEDRGVARWMGEQLGERISPDVPRHLGGAFLTLHRLAERNEKQVSRLSRLGQVPVTRLPLAERDISDLASLAQLAAWLQGKGLEAA
jgi:anion-transporting  ArsA/GET3 family ATPase